MPHLLEVDHPRQNHGGCFLSSDDVGQLMGAVKAGGWIPGAVDHTSCFQVPQGGVRRMVLCEDTFRRLASSSGDALTIVREDTRRRLAMSSGGGVPAAAPGSTTYASLACGHTNACLRAIRSSSGWGNTALGNAAAEPRFNEAAQDGFNWHVVPHREERPNPAPGVVLAAGRPKPRYTGVQV